MSWGRSEAGQSRRPTQAQAGGPARVRAPAGSWQRTHTPIGCIVNGRTAMTCRLGAVMLLALVAVVHLPTAADADPNSSNIKATQAYLGAVAAEARAVTAARPAGVKALARFRARIGAECAGALAGSAESAERGEINAEVLHVATTVVTLPAAPALARFSGIVARLRWTSSQLTGLIRSQALAQLRLAKVALPDLCEDIKEWVAGGYRTLPLGTVQFQHRIEAALGTRLVGPLDSLEEPISGMLRPYESGTQKKTAHHLSELLVQVNAADTEVTVPGTEPIIAELSR